MKATALLMAAGKATRLVGVRERWAKANVPVGPTTPLRFLLEKLHLAGYRRCWVNLHHLPEQVEEEARRWAPPGLELAFLEEPELLGTGGTLLEVSRREGSLPTAVVNAKMITDFDFAQLRQAPGPAMVLHAQSRLEEFGGLRFDGDARLLGLQGRDLPLEDGFSAAVYTGICRPDPAWIPHLEAAESDREASPCCLVRHGLLPAIADGSASATALLHRGFWMEISTPKRLQALRQEIHGFLR